MNSRVVWTDQVPFKEGTKNAINDMAISPDGTKLVVAVGTRVLLYNFKTGDLLESLNAHKDIVTTVSFSFDNSRFASGGADSMVILWKATGTGFFLPLIPPTFSLRYLN
jgi:intraflagellar transport protein 122